MFLHVHPKPPLSKHVEVLWYHESYSPGSPRERLLPTGTLEIVIDLTDQPSRIFRDENDSSGVAAFRSSVVSGPQSRYFVLDTSAPQTVAGIHFAPGGAARFFREPLSELRDRHLSLDDLWGHSASSSLRDRILDASSPAAKLRVVEDALYSRAVRLPVGESRHRAIDYVLDRFAAIPQIETLETVTSQLLLSPRRFIQLFSEETGLTPKLLCRIFRFQAALKLANLGRTINWSAVAADCGYFDQSHFIHDFKAFTGLSPTTYLQARGPNLNHVPLAG
ncbi:MAG TPA: AraC family transcriptional regulator [Bryobacteraceae bacterium]|jgi:AraC-like DNA-binding protein